jgi:hypothetical protein
MAPVTTFARMGIQTVEPSAGITEVQGKVAVLSTGRGAHLAVTRKLDSVAGASKQHQG